MTKDKPVKIDAPFLQLPLLQLAFALARKAGGEGRLVGGLVRDWLRGHAADTHSDDYDYDMAVTVPIGDFMAQVKSYQSEMSNLRLIETGVAHGSIMLCCDGVCVEVTQTRADIATDGRHAVIGFTPCFETDAGRRDFTINALYLAQDGTLHDPLGAMADITAKKLRFIGAAAARIEEDYLRLLRFFRFIAQLEDFTPERENMAVMPALFDGLSTLSGERIFGEMRKLFASPNWQEAVQLMSDSGVDHHLFGGSFLPPHAADDRLACWQSIAAARLDDAARNGFLALPFASADKALIQQLATPLTASDYQMLQTDKWQQVAHFGGADFAQRCAVQSRFHEPMISGERLAEIASFCPPPCPVTGHDLQQAGIAAGPQIGQLLHKAERLYVESGYQLDGSAILAELLADDASDTGN